MDTNIQVQIQIHVHNFRIIYQTFKNKIDSIDGNTINQTDIDEYDVIFRLNNIFENKNVLFISGFIGYDFDSIVIELVYDMNENNIYITSQYRLLDFVEESKLYKDTFQMVYDKTWNTEQSSDGYIIQEKKVRENYKKINEKAIPYYRFSKSKDGISIPRVIYNIFTIFSDETSSKPKPNIIIPNNLNIYRTTV